MYCVEKWPTWLSLLRTGSQDKFNASVKCCFVKDIEGMEGVNATINDRDVDEDIFPVGGVHDDDNDNVLMMMPKMFYYLG